MEECTPDNPKIRRPTQENTAGTQPQRNNKYMDSCATTVNQVIDKILHNQDNTNRVQEAAAIQDASSWTEEEKRDCIQYRKNKGSATLSIAAPMAHIRHRRDS